jgi:hypothetical protein
VSLLSNSRYVMGVANQLTWSATYQDAHHRGAFRACPRVSASRPTRLPVPEPLRRRSVPPS